MFRNSQTIIPYDDIDFEIRELVKILNQFEGIETESCCFGHHKRPCSIYFKAETIEDIVNLSFNLFDCQDLWHIEINTQDIHKDWIDLHFVLHTGDIKDYPTVDLLVSNLTLRAKGTDIMRRARSTDVVKNNDEFQKFLDGLFQDPMVVPDLL